MKNVANNMSTPASQKYFQKNNLLKIRSITGNC